MTITFTQQEKESFLINNGFIIDTVQGYINDNEGQVDYPVKIAMIEKTWDSYITRELTGAYFANIQTEYGIDTVFEKEIKKKLLEL